jgi:predicted transcriptional regulator
MQNLNTQNRIYNTQNALASELNRQQMNVDQIRAAYAEQGVSSPDISIGDVNTLKYV